MPEQLKIIIDADVNKAIAGVQNLSKVIALDFANATKAASTAATNLSSDVAASVQKINASLSKKIKAPDLDTSGLLASIKLIDSELLKATHVTQFQGIGVKLNKLKEDFDKLRGFKIDVDLDISKATNEIVELSVLIANTKYSIELTGGAEKEAKKLSAAFREITSLSERLQEVNSIIKDLSNGVRLPKHEGMSEADINGIINRLKEEQAALIKSSAAIKERANAILSLPSIKKIADQQIDFTLPRIVSSDFRDLRDEINAFAHERIKLNIDTSNFGVLKFDNSKVLAGIKEVKSEIASIATKPLNIDTTGIKNAAKVVSSDFVKATEVAASAGFNLSERFAAATARINASIDKMVDDALKGVQQIKSSFGDFGAVTLDSSQVNAAVEQLKIQLEGLQAQVPLTITSTGLEKLNTDIAETKAQLNSLISKNIRVDVDATAALQKISLLKTDLRTISNVPFKFDASQAISAITGLQNQVKRLDSSLKTVGGLNNFHAELGKSTAAVDLLQRKGAGLNAFYSNLVTANNSAVNSLQKFPNATNASSFAMLNFGRVIQDAPFGILGIANNLNPLIESLQRASVAAKATGTSLSKNLLGALGGAGGIGIAISAVSSLLIVFGDRLFGAGKKAKDATTEMAGHIEFEFDRIQKRISEATDAISKDAAKMSILISSINDGVLPLKERKKAIDEVLSIYPEYLNSLEKEKSSYEKITTSISDSIQQLAQAAEIKALLPNFEQIFQKAIKAQLQLNELRRFSTVRPKGTKITASDLFGVDEAEFNEEVRQLEGKINSAKKEIEVAKKSLATIAGGELNLIRILFGDRLKETPKELKDVTDEIISRAKLAAAEFGKSFVVPDLEITFFKNKDAVFKEAKDFLGDVKSFLGGNVGALKIKIPVLTDFEFIPESVGGVSKEIEDLFFKSAKLDKGIDVNVLVTPDFSLAKGNLDAIDKKLNLRQQFSVLGDLGLKEFSKIDFSNINAGISEATKKLEQMMAIATTLNQAIGQGLAGAFNAVFDAVLEGRSVFKALGQAVKELVVNTIKAVAQMLILRLVTNAIFPGAGAVKGLGALVGGAIGGSANFGQLSGIGNRAFDNSLQINVVGQISGDVINLAGQRAANSQRRGG